MTHDVENRIRAMLAERAQDIGPDAQPRFDELSHRSGLLAGPRRAPALTAAAVTVALLGAFGAIAHTVASSSPVVNPGSTTSPTPTPTPSPTSAPASPGPSPSQSVESVFRQTAGQADAVRHYFATDPAWLAKLAPAIATSRTFCGVDILGGSSDGQQLYLWLLCEQFAVVNGKVTLRSTTSQPALATVSGSGPATKVLRWTAATDGSGHGPSLLAMFPRDIAERAMVNQNPQPTPSQLAARAAADLAPFVGSSPTSTFGPTSPPTLVPADSAAPAASSCDPQAGAVVTVLAVPAVPSPRCVEIGADQQLRIVNQSNQAGEVGQAVTVTFANFAPRVIQVGQSTTFEVPAAQYLATGVHIVRMSLYGGGSGAEVWLK